VILDVHGEVALARPQRNALRNRPARKRSVPFEAKVVVEPPRGMALDDEDRPLASALAGFEGLRRLSRATLLAIFLERHLWIVAVDATLSSPKRCFLDKSPAHRGFPPWG
jgi:hypothetical protein